MWLICGSTQHRHSPKPQCNTHNNRPCALWLLTVPRGRSWRCRLLPNMRIGHPYIHPSVRPSGTGNKWKKKPDGSSATMQWILASSLPPMQACHFDPDGSISPTCPHELTGLTCPTHEWLREFTTDWSRSLTCPQWVVRSDLSNPWPIDKLNSHAITKRS